MQHNSVTKQQNRPGYRLRAGDWRVIYELEDDKLIILVLKIESCRIRPKLRSEGGRNLLAIDNGGTTTVPPSRTLAQRRKSW